jgi:hypothetical protein
MKIFFNTATKIHSWMNIAAITLTKSKGIAMLTKIVPEQLQKVHTETMSMLFARFKMFDLLSIYKFADFFRIDEFTEQVLKYVDLPRPVFLIGDINIDLIRQPNNKFSKQLRDLGFIQLVKEATHISGGLLNHLYVYFPQDELFKIHPLYLQRPWCCVLHKRVRLNMKMKPKDISSLPGGGH